MKGYIAITSSEWFDTLKENLVIEAVFWRKRLAFKALEEGDYYFFYVKNKATNIRQISGYALYKSSSTVNCKDAWRQYHSKLGSNSEDGFLENVSSIYKTTDITLGCIYLTDVVFFDEPIDLDACKIEFSPYIVSGKTITQEDCKTILENSKGRIKRGTT